MPASAGPAWLAWLEATAWGTAMRHSPWLYPAVEIVHLVGVVLLAGSVALLDLRVLGLSRALRVRALARHALPLAWAGFGLVAVSGALLFSAHATELGGKPVFALKLGLIAAAGANALWFHRGPYAQAAHWDSGATAPRAARVAAALSLALWLAVIACGRLLAYL
ncbi:MAG: hypothetical protein N2688_02420 [Burkholderiaceae bacterium]|nr:hypothetical protein [Burkholderiaceae bacterium]